MSRKNRLIIGVVVGVLLGVGYVTFFKSSTPYLSGGAPVETLVPLWWPKNEVQVRGNEALLFSNGVRIDAYREVTQRYPETLAELEANGVVINQDAFSGIKPRYVLAVDGKSFALTFTGPDGEYDTADDVAYDRARLANATLPFYGGQKAVKTPAQLYEDKQFIDSVVATAGTREKGAANFIAESKASLEKGDFDAAIQQLNKAWLLNPENTEIEKGFADIAARRG